MMTPILQWYEPKGFVRMIRAATPRWIRFAGPTVLFLMTIGICLVFWTSADPNKRPPFVSVLWTAPVFGLLMALLPLISRRFPRQVRFSDHAISRISGNELATTWKYAEIAGWAILETPFRGDKVRVLVLALRNGKMTMIGIADAIEREQIAFVLSQRKIQELNYEKAV